MALIVKSCQNQFGFPGHVGPVICYSKTDDSRDSSCEKFHFVDFKCSNKNFRPSSANKAMLSDRDFMPVRFTHAKSP